MNKELTSCIRRNLLLWTNSKAEQEGERRTTLSGSSAPSWGTRAPPSLVPGPRGVAQRRRSGCVGGCASPCVGGGPRSPALRSNCRVASSCYYSNPHYRDLSSRSNTATTQPVTQLRGETGHFSGAAGENSQSSPGRKS